MHAQKIAAHSVSRFHSTKVLVVILVQFATGVQANFIQHAREIHHPARHFSRALRVYRHRWMNESHHWSQCNDAHDLQGAAASKATRGRPFDFAQGRLFTHSKSFRKMEKTLL
jgi:hypothetical protein